MARAPRYRLHRTRYIEHGGTAASCALGVPEHEIVETLGMEDDTCGPLIVPMHGDRNESTKNLVRQIGRRRVAPRAPAVAQRHTGDQVGGTSPFGTRKALPVFVERSVRALLRILIDGGRRGDLVRIDSAVLTAALGATAVDCALPG